jgi:hypothetical protein
MTIKRGYFMGEKNYGLDRENRLQEKVRHILGLVSQHSVEWQTGWGYYINIKEEFGEIGRIGFTLNHDRSRLDLGMHFGDTLEQAKELYSNQNVKYEDFASLAPDFEPHPNLHVGIPYPGPFTHIAWFKTPKGREREYFEYWRKNWSGLKADEREYILDALKELVDNKLINEIGHPNKYWIDQLRLPIRSREEITIEDAVNKPEGDYPMLVIRPAYAVVVYEYCTVEDVLKKEGEEIASDLRTKISKCFETVLKKKPFYLAEGQNHSI